MQPFPTDFVIPFIYNKPEDIRCCWQRLSQGPLPYAQKHWLTYGTDYIVSHPEEQDLGGKLTILARLPSEANQLVIRRFTPKTQKIDLHNGARLPAELIESMSDKSTMIVQELAEQMTSKDSELELRIEANDAIEAEEKARQKADTELGIKIEIETTARQQADNNLNSKIEKLVADEINVRQQAFRQLNDKIKTEVDERKQEDSQIIAHINDEIEARQQADSELYKQVEKAIEAEATLRKNAEKELDDKKQNVLPDGETPLINSATGKVNDKYLPGALTGAAVTVDGIQADQNNNVQTRFFLAKECFDEAQRPLKPGRYIVYGEDQTASLVEVDSDGNEYLFTGDMLPAISKIDDDLVSILG